MSERPFMQLYVSDFVGDTLSLSAEQVGAYMLLLMAMWNADGKLPNEERKLATIVRMSLKKWRAVAPDLMSFFHVEDGSISHRRLTKELQKSERQSQSRSAAGVRGFQAKSLKYNNAAQANAQAGLKHSPEPYRKKGEPSVGSGSGSSADGVEIVDRYSEEALFQACERIRGKTAPISIQRFSFPRDIVSQARKELAH